MLAVTSVIIDYTLNLKNAFLTFYTLQARPPKRRWARCNLHSTLPLDGPGCVNNALINALKN